MRASIEKLSAHIQSQPHLDADEKAELLSLLSDIESEVETAAGDAHPLATTMDLAAGIEAPSLPDQLEENLLKIEATYPKTAAALGRIADVLSRMGI